MQQELRLAFQSVGKKELTPAEVFSLLHAIGVACTPAEQQAVIDAFQESGAFNCEEFVDIAESLGFSETAQEKLECALELLTEQAAIKVGKLQQMIAVAGARIGLTAVEAQEFLRFQLGPRSFDKPRVSLREALGLLN